MAAKQSPQTRIFFIRQVNIFYMSDYTPDDQQQKKPMKEWDGSHATAGASLSKDDLMPGNLAGLCPCLM